MIRRLWRRHRYTDCAMCGASFRKGKGSGVSGSVICSYSCWAAAWRQFVKGP